jgi:hypothetical protein
LECFAERKSRFCLNGKRKVKVEMCLDMKRYERLYKAEKNAKNNNLPLIHSFLNRKVKVKVSEGLEIRGILLRYQLQSKGEHKPNLLILKDGDSFHFIRGNWLSISECEK